MGAIKDKILSFIMMLLGNHLNYYTSYLGSYRSSLVTLVFRFFAPKVTIPKEDIDAIRQLEKKGTIIYANKNRSSLDFLFYHHRYEIDGLPYPIFGNFINMIWWQPVKSVIKIFLSKLYCIIDGSLAPNPYRTNYVRRMTEEGHSSILFLRHPTGLLKRFALKETDDPMVYLLKAQKIMKRDIFIVPHITIYHKRPLTEKKTLMSALFGPRVEPGLFRRIVVFLRNYKKAFIKIGDPVNLREFLKEKSGVEINGELSYELRRRLLDGIEREERLVTGPIRKKRGDIIEMALWDDEFQEEIKKLANSSGKSQEKLRKKAISYFQEIAADISNTYVRISDHILTWVWNNIYDGVDIDEEGLNKIREAGRRSTLVLVPCHKSHMDYLMLSYVFYHNNLYPPHIAAGSNLSFFPMGHIFRKTGAFFMRRTFKGQPLYAISFSAYMKVLISEGFSIEFFIEGGRSRTGKLVMPKLGLLSIIMDAYLSGVVNDISFVPIFIGYDKIMEESSYIQEMTGVEKEKETLKSMLSSRRLLKKRYGRVHINISDPISLGEFFESSGHKNEDITRAEMRQLQYDLAYNIVHSINEVSVVTPINLVSAAFMSYYRGALYKEELFDTVSSLVDYLSYTGARFSGTLKNREASINDALKQLIDEDLVSEIKEEPDEDDSERVFFVPENKRHNLEFYKNNILHFFLPAAFISTSILSRRNPTITIDEIIEDYTFLRRFFKFDFIYDLKYPDSERVNQVLGYLLENEIISEKDNSIKINDRGEKTLTTFSGLIRNYIESYFVTLSSLTKYIDKGQKSEKDLIKRIHRVGEKMYKRGEITRNEALSRMNFKNALKLLSHEEVVNIKWVADGKRPVKLYSMGSEKKGYIKRLRRYLTKIGQ